MPCPGQANSKSLGSGVSVSRSAPGACGLHGRMGPSANLRLSHPQEALKKPFSVDAAVVQRDLSCVPWSSPEGTEITFYCLMILLQLLLDMQILSSMAFSKLKKENFRVVLNNLYWFFSSNFTWINFTNHKFIQLKHTIQYLLI